MKSSNNNFLRDTFSNVKPRLEKSLTIQNRKIPRKDIEDSKSFKKTKEEVPDYFFKPSFFKIYGPLDKKEMSLVLPKAIPSYSVNRQLTFNNTSMIQNQNQIGNINVICRFRPLNNNEKNNAKDICAEFVDEEQIILKSSTECNNYRFSFDRIFEMSSTQQEIFETAAQPIIESVLEGFNGTVFAYGQTASGKTHTMQGDLDNIEQEGITPRMIRHVFNYFASSNSDTEFTVKVSLFEIYMEKVNDLIQSDRTNLNIREDKVKGIYIDDLTEHYVCSEEEVFEFIKTGSANRASGTTNMNEHSSRSHLIFLMTIHQTNVKSLISKTGKLYLVDLAGSEKISKTGATGMTLEEAKNINKSLTTLGMVINNLTDGKSQHIPYRDSKLTRILQESIGGNSKTRLIITCSPSVYNEQETLSTLRFGNRAKKIRNKPIINKEVTVAELKLEVDKLEKLLLICNGRVTQLDGFIKTNNLALPEEEEFSFGKWEKKIKETISKVEGAEIEVFAIEKNDLESIKSPAEFNFKLAENKDGDTTYNTLRQEENEKKTKELNDKYSELVQQLNLLESDKSILNEQYEEALKRNREFSGIVQEKEKFIEEIKLKSFKDFAQIVQENEKIVQEKEKIIEEIKLKSNRESSEIEQEKEKMIEEIRMKSFKEFSEIIQEKEKLVQEKEKLIEDIKLKSNKEFSEIVKEKEKILHEKEKMIEDIKLKSNREFSKIVQEKEKIIQEKEKVVKEKERMVQEKEKIIEEVKLKSKSYSEIPEEVFAKLKSIFTLDENSNQGVFEIEFNGLISDIKNKLNIKYQTDRFTEEKILNFDIVQENSFDLLGTENGSEIFLEERSFQNDNNNNNVIESVYSTELISKINPLFTEQEFKKLKIRFTDEKRAIIKTLEEKSEKISSLDFENKELKNKFKIIEMKLTPDDKNYVKKIISLEKSLEQVNHMYHNVVTQKSVLKIENQVLEKKIKKRNEKIKAIEIEGNDLKEQIKLRDEQLASKFPPQKMSMKNLPASIVKIIRGGTILKANSGVIQSEQIPYPSNIAVNQGNVEY